MGFTQKNAIQKADSLFYIHKQTNGPGVSISVYQNGQPSYKNHHGLANLEHQIPISDSTVFLVGSISKQFTAFAILLIENEGKLSIDDSVAKYLPELKELDYGITIRQLANHTSGFRNNSDLNNLRGRSNEDLTSQQEMVALLLKQKTLNFIPGKRFQYCNSGYILLAEIVQRVSGIPFSEFVKTNIFTPLEMTNSQFLEYPTTIVKNKANSYYKAENQYHYYPMNRTVQGSTGLHTTTDDLTKWIQNFAQPKIGNQTIVSKMITPSKLNSGTLIPYGLGQETKMYRGLKVIFHGGGDAGYRAYLLQVPEYSFSVAIAGNFESFNPLNLAYGMIDIFLSKHIIQKPISKPPFIPQQQQLKKFSGNYQIFPGLYIRIIAKNDSLYFQPYGTTTELPLPALSKNEFEFPHRAHSKFVFTKDHLQWHFSDFSYPGKKVNLNPPNYKDIQTDQYLGIYYCEELETTYTFIKKEGEIIATHSFNADIILKPIDTDAFITDNSFLSRVTFIRNQNNQIIGCKISGQTAYHIHFEKQDCH
jgi:CubicO group peptidase (beta-lactamase class C family)